MSLLLLFSGASGTVSVTPLSFGAYACILAPDEIAVGVPCTLYFQIVDSTGVLALDQAAQWKVWGFDSSGVRTAVTATAYMTQVGSADLWQATWTPAAKGTYEIQMFGEINPGTPTTYATSRSLTVRPKFDPIGFAVDEVLVSRTGDDEVLGTA